MEEFRPPAGLRNSKYPRRYESNKVHSRVGFKMITLPAVRRFVCFRNDTSNNRIYGSCSREDVCVLHPEMLYSCVNG